jgi:hypothetical protein
MELGVSGFSGIYLNLLARIVRLRTFDSYHNPSPLTLLWYSLRNSTSFADLYSCQLSLTFERDRAYRSRLWCCVRNRCSRTTKSARRRRVIMTFWLTSVLRRRKLSPFICHIPTSLARHHVTVCRGSPYKSDEVRVRRVAPGGLGVFCHPVELEY